MMCTDRGKMFLVVILAWMAVSCAADPWPEPDSMRNDEAASGDGNGDNRAGGDASSDYGDTGGDGSEPVLDQDSDTGRYERGTDSVEDKSPGADAGEADSEADTARQDDTTGTDALSSDLLADRVFVSAPASTGEVTVVGLSGAVPPDSTLSLAVDGRNMGPVAVGVDGGFAMRFETGGEDIALLVETEAGIESSLALPGTSPEASFPDDLRLGEVAALSDSLVSVSGEGGVQTRDAIVVVGNVSRSSAGATSTVCETERCAFSLVLSASPGDVLDVFVVPRTREAEWTGAQAGTATQTLVVE